MKIDILTLFPEMFDAFLNTSIIKRAIAKGVVNIQTHNIRDFTLDKYGRVDDYSCGGGAGLIMKPQPILDCLQSVKQPQSKTYIMSPKGAVFSQSLAHTFAKEEHLILVCGHYEGVDERIMQYMDGGVSIGDYILTGGELASMVISDAVIRLLQGAISEASPVEESFENGLLEYPQYTLPRVYQEQKIPDILFSGNHKAIKKWRLKESLRSTLQYRPELLRNRTLSKEEKSLLQELQDGIEEPKWLMDAIADAKKFME